MSENVRIKKIKAFPLPVTFKIGTNSMPGQILKMTLQGFIADFALKTVRPGDKIEASFEIPIAHHWVTEPCVVVKIYSHYATPGADTTNVTSGEAAKTAPASGSGAATSTSGGSPAPAPTDAPKAAQMVEFHFQALQLSNRERLNAFLLSLRKI